VTVQDAQGNTVPTSTTSITLAIGTNPASGTLAGYTTVAAVNGVATFANVSVNKPGAGYTFTASATALPGASSSSFNITAPITTGPGLTRLSAGSGQTCGVAAGGAAYCWGYNAFGQLGNGSTTNSATPVAVSGGLSFATVSAGNLSPCGVTTGGAAYCWGDNSYGELGNGTTTTSLTPVAVSGGLSFATLNAGSFVSTCGVTTSGAAYCWGDNQQGELGIGSITGPQTCVGVYSHGSGACSLTPVAVSGGLSFATVSASYLSTCGVTTGGAAYCWGDNSFGQLGNGTTTSSATPVAVSGGLSFATVSAGLSSACGVTTGGAAYCWGLNVSELGNAPVAVSGGVSFATVSVGGIAICGVTTSGAAYCWGDNQYGELGNGTTTGSARPVAVSGGLSFATVSAGVDFACGVTTGGAAYCWGVNSFGQLGNGSTTNSLTPVAVSGGLSF